MSLAFEKMVAGRYLGSQRREGFISVIAGFSFLGIMLGVATLIIVMSVMNGFREELVSRILGLNGHINVYAPQGELVDYDPIIFDLENIKNVSTVAPVVEGQALLSLHGTAAGVVVRGITMQDLETKPILSESIIARLRTAEGLWFDGPLVSIGKTLAERYGLTVGSEFVLIAPQGRATPFGTIPRSRTFTVGSIFDVGMYEYNSSFVFMPLETAKNFYQKQGVSALEIITPNPAEVAPVRKEIERVLAGQALVRDWRDTNATFYNALSVERNVMFVILTLIILVAAFNIISSLIMLVKDKGRDIAILRTMGASRGMIVRIFFYTGASIGVFGTLAGAALGVLVATNIETLRRWLEGLTDTELFSDEIYFLTQLPSRMDGSEVIMIILMALGLSFAATIYPAWRAARLDPVEALRNE